MFFFFQAEDGIRDIGVTGVQTCALPICTPEIDALFAQFVSEPDTDAQVELGNQIDALLWGQVATVPLYQKPTFLAHQSTIEGPEDNSTEWGPLWNSETWTVQ